MQNKTLLTDQEIKFWTRFSETHWEKKPLHVKSIVSCLTEIDKDYLFNMLVRYSDHCRKTRTTPGFKLYIDGQLQFELQTLQFLPGADDQSLLGYHQRMSRYFKDYCLICDELIQVAYEKFGLLQNLLRCIYSKVGIPNQFTELGLYLGNYKKTPFGVHEDGCGVLSIPVVGTKQFRLWTSKYAHKNPDLMDAKKYPDHIVNSKLLIVKPGDIAYWPSSTWHIAESSGTFSATWSLGMWVNKPCSELSLDILRPLVVEALEANGNQVSIRCNSLFDSTGHVKELPPVLDKLKLHLSKTTNTQWHQLFLSHWLVTTSKSGFKSCLLPDKKTKITKNDLICGVAGNPILWSELDTKKTAMAINGTIIIHAKSKNLVQLIKQINSLETFCAGQHGLLKLLQEILVHRGVCKVTKAL